VIGLADYAFVLGFVFFTGFVSRRVVERAPKQNVLKVHKQAA
jgi:hypothetical protein